MEFKQVAEAVDVKALSSQKENLAKQLDSVNKQEATEIDRAMKQIKAKYANAKNRLTMQIQKIDKDVSQEAINLKNNLDTISQSQKNVAQQPVQQATQQTVGQPAQANAQKNEVGVA